MCVCVYIYEWIQPLYTAVFWSADSLSEKVLCIIHQERGDTNITCLYHISGRVGTKIKLS